MPAEDVAVVSPEDRKAARICRSTHCVKGSLMDIKITEQTRELSRRRTGSAEVLLLWYPATDDVELRVHDSAGAESFELRVPPGDAMDAFRHPYAYAARRDSSRLRPSTHVSLERPDPNQSLERNP
jgi:hypothetical protein